MTNEDVARYCRDCFYYRGLPAYKKRCYFRIWESKDVRAPSQILRRNEKCEHYVRKSARV